MSFIRQMRILYPKALILFFRKKMLEAFPEITYVRGASGQLAPVLRGTRLRVQTVVIAAPKWIFRQTKLPLSMT
jgi:hypothetical protein